MIRAIVVDDEKKSREILIKLIDDLSLNVVVVNQANSVQDGYQVINDEVPQLVFLDVEMLDGTGFDLLEKFDEINFEVVFVTAYDKYAIKAFKYSAIDYLLKPIDVEELKSTILKIEESLKVRIGKNDFIKTLLTNVRQENRNKKIAIKGASKIDLVNRNDIICCYADKAYTDIITVEGKKITASKPLKYFELMFNDDANFFRVSKSSLINLDYVKSYKKDQEIIQLENAIEVEVSRRKKKEFLELLKLV